MNRLKVLIPTDFSVQAEFAFLLAQNMGHKMPMDIHFLHVLQVPETVSLDADGAIITCGEIDPGFVMKQKEIAERNLQNLRSSHGEHHQTHLVFGKITEQVVRFAESGHFDLVVMGTKGATGLRERLAGSETQLIVRKCAVPVLSLMCDRSDLEVKDILIVHDFLAEESVDLPVLANFLKAFEPKVHLLQIVRNKAEQADAELRMQKFADKNALTNALTHVLTDKDVESGVIHFTQMHNADIVCIGTHGKGGLWHNSATERLINHLFKPMITFRIKL